MYSTFKQAKKAFKLAWIRQEKARVLALPKESLPIVQAARLVC